MYFVINSLVNISYVTEPSLYPFSFFAKTPFNLKIIIASSLFFSNKEKIKHFFVEL